MTVGQTRGRIEAAMRALEAQRVVLGDAVVEAALAPLRTQLAAAQGQVLKQVSILFLDVVGSTALSQRLDPEQVHALMDGALARCSDIVRAHAGKVLQYAGDNLLAAFGAEAALEDDPELAVRCALALVAEGQRLQSQILARHGLDGGQVRVGIHTGAVLLGGGVDAEGTIRGLAVNVAARMEQTAPEGGVRISQDTHALVRGHFSMREQAPMQVKGVDAPVRTWLVERALPRAFRDGSRGIEGLSTPMIGREGELALLMSELQHAASGEQARAVIIVAPAGLGKSRLLAQFETEARAHWPTSRWLCARAQPHGQQRAFGVLRDLIAWWFDIGDDDPMSAAKVALEEGYLRATGADDALSQAHWLGHLIGLDFSDSVHLRGIAGDARQLRQLGKQALLMLLLAASKQADAPLVTVIEDLHWADEASLDLLDELLVEMPPTAWMLVASARPGLHERRAHWPSGTHARVDLADLTHQQVLVLLEQLLSRLPEPPPALTTMLTDRAQGNPFFLEELIKMLIDRGVIDANAGVWHVDAARLDSRSVPVTLVGVLQARLDSLASHEREGLQAASVIGHVFWDDALRKIEPGAENALPTMVQRDLAQWQETSAFEDLQAYAFRHHLLHQVTYDSVLRRERQRLHGAAATWLVERAGDRQGEFAGEIAEHYERADDPANAATFHAHAAEQAGARMAHSTVLHHAGRALSLLDLAGGGDSATRRRALLARERTWNLQSRRTEQAADLDVLAALCATANDDAGLAMIERSRADMYLRLAEWEACETAARSAIELASRANEASTQLMAQCTLSNALSCQQRYDEAFALASAGLDESRSRGLSMPEAGFLNCLAYICSERRQVMQSIEFSRQTYAVCLRSGDTRGLAVAQANIGVDCQNIGDFEGSLDALNLAQAMARRAGDRICETTNFCNLAETYRQLGDLEQARRSADEGLRLADQCAARQLRERLELNRALIDLEGGQPDVAVSALAQLSARMQDSNDPARLDVMAALAQAQLAADRPQEAMATVTALIEAGQASDFTGVGYPRELYWCCFSVFDRMGDPRAAFWLARAHNALMTITAEMPDATSHDRFLRATATHRNILAAASARGLPSAPAS